MYETFFRSSEYLAWPLTALVFFVAFFTGVVGWVLSGHRREQWEHAAAQPLYDGAPPSPLVQEP